MKILYHHRTRSKDGQAVHIEELIAALRELGHEVIVVAPPALEHQEFGSDAGLVSALKRHMPKAVYELMELAYSWHAYRRLKSAIREHQPDCIYERYNLFFPAGIWAKRKFGLPFILEVNGPIYFERKTFDGLALDQLAHWSERMAWRNADAVLPVTQVLAEMIVAEGVARERIEVIPNGINLAHFAHADPAPVRQRWGLEGKLVLGFTGFVREWHGMDRVIACIANDAPGSARHLLVVGDGPVRAALEQQAEALGVRERVHFTGIVPREDIPAHVAAFDIALQPAVVAHASPLKLFEYLALGRAVVAPAVPNIREILEHEHNALLFDENDPQALGAAIDRLSADVVLRARLADAARKTIHERGLTWQRNAERVVERFRALGVRDEVGSLHTGQINALATKNQIKPRAA